MKVDVLDAEWLSLTASPVSSGRIRELPGIRWSSALDLWKVPRSYVIWIALWAEFSDVLELTDSVRSWVEECYQHELTLWEARRTTPEPHPSLRPGQVQGVNWLELTGSAVLADDMGGGKTVQACFLMNRDDSATHILVACPLALGATWVKHVLDWTRYTPILGMGGAKKRRDAIAEWKENGGVLILNYESLRLHSRLAHYSGVAFKKCPDHGGSNPDITDTKCEVHLKELNGVDIDWFIWDEAHKAKNPKSAMTRAVKYLCASSRHRLALTGTPVEDSPADLWSLLNAVDPVGWPSRGAFIDRYCALSYNPHSGGMDVAGIRPDRAEEFHRAKTLYVLRRSFAELTGRDIKKVYSTFHVKLPPKHLSLYRKITKDLSVDLGEGSDPLLITDTGSANIRAQMATGAPLMCQHMGVDEDGQIIQRVWLEGKSPKVDALWDFWDDDLKRAPLVVMAGGPGSSGLLRLAQERWEKEGVPYSCIKGGMTSHEREEAETLYMEGDHPVFFGQTQAAGEGLTLDRGHTLAFLQRPGSLRQNKQAEDRVRRYTQKSDTVHIVDFVAQDTVDERLLVIRQTKESLFQEVMRDPEKLKELL